MQDNPGRRLVFSHAEEILDFFGKCGACGYPADASTTSLRYDNGDSETKVIARCCLPCGWTDEVTTTRMTRGGSGRG